MRCLASFLRSPGLRCGLRTSYFSFARGAFLIKTIPPAKGSCGRFGGSCSRVACSPRSCPQCTRGGPAACAGTSTATRATTSARPRAWWSPWWRTSATPGSCTRTARTCGSSTATRAASTRAWVRAPGDRGLRGAPRAPTVRCIHATGRPRGGREALGLNHQHLIVCIWIILYPSKSLCGHPPWAKPWEREE